jgi:hypothetical protein
VPENAGSKVKITGPQKIKVYFDGVSDDRDVDNSKATINYKITADILGKEQNFTINGIFVDKTIYFKLAAPSLSLFMGPFEGQWIKIDRASLQDLGAGEEGLKVWDSVMMGGRTSEEKELFEKARAALYQTKIIKLTNQLKDEKIDSVSTRHYKFAVDKTEIKNLVLKINEVVASEDRPTAAEMAELDEELAQADLPEGEIWIGKKDFLPYKVTFTFEIKETEKVSGSGRIDFVFKFKNFNQPVSVVAPSSSKTISEALEVFKSLFEGKNSSEIKSSKDSIFMEK